MYRIALISEHASPLASAGGVDSGGQNIYVANVAKALAARGLAVDVYTRRHAPDLPSIVPWGPDRRVIHLDAGPTRPIPKEQLLPYMPAFAAQLGHSLDRPQMHCAVLHANFFMSGWAGLQVARRTGIALVTTFHALGRVRRLHQREADQFPDLRFQMEDELVRYSDRIVAECPQDHADLVQLYKADPAAIDIVPCGFDPQELEPMDKREARRALGWPLDEFIVLQLGRMVPRKGVDNVIRGVARLGRAAGGTAARLVIAGGDLPAARVLESPEIRRLAGIARDEGVAERVQFFGQCPRERLSLLYSAADVFVTTPWYEPFGITPLEAMACACPVIGADVGGIRSTVVDGTTGFLVPPKDPAALAACLSKLQRAPALGKRLGRAGRKRALERYTWAHVCEGLLKAYRRAARDSLNARGLRPTVRKHIDADRIHAH